VLTVTTATPVAVDTVTAAHWEASPRS